MHKLIRYGISVLGIIIGIACAVATLSIVEGGKASIYKYFGSRGLKVYTLESEGKLESEDAKLIEREMPEVQAAMPVLKAQGVLKSYAFIISAVPLI